VSIPTFVATGPFVPGHEVALGEVEAHHIRVRRLDVGARVRLVDGQGARASGVLVRVARRSAGVEVQEAATEAPPPAVHLLVPIADKERMLLVAEKAAELGATSWRPVMFRRSRSVAGRGEGPMFVRKVLARMTAALEQSGGAWLPMVYPDANVERAVAAVPEGLRVVLDASGAPLASVVGAALAGEPRPGAVLAGAPAAGAVVGDEPAVRGDASPVPSPPVVTLVVGPEGGIESDELAVFTDAGFVRAAIGRTILRFETAAVAALGVVQSFLPASGDR
jgi:16S rRNA (uracil1498-N3)-methyltransferase